MSNEQIDLIKQRELHFSGLHADQEQARSAAAMLVGYPGILFAEAQSDLILAVHYNLVEITLDDILAVLEQHGFHFDNNVMAKVRRALYRYTEETQRANMGCAKGESNCTQKVFASNYRKQDHGCRDHRPEHWRKYL